MKRLEYISRSLSKIQHKKFELYVISRIIHKLDNPEIKYVFQQYATRDNNTGKYALIDLYLPQLGIAIEVDESHHKEQYTEDEIRQKEIEQLDIQVERVQCYEKSLEEVNNEIEKIIEKIITKKNELGDNFKPWNGLNGYEYYTKKGYFDINDSTELTSPTEICNCFGLENPAEVGASNLDNNYKIWWPNENYEKDNGKNLQNLTVLSGKDKSKMIDPKSRWYNNLVYNSILGECVIIEDDLDRKESEVPFYKEMLDKVKDGNYRNRIVFYKKRNMLHDKLYRFVGVFELDTEKTEKYKVCIHRRIANTFELPKYLDYVELYNCIDNFKSKNIKSRGCNNKILQLENQLNMVNKFCQSEIDRIQKMEEDYNKHIEDGTYDEYRENYKKDIERLKREKNIIVEDEIKQELNASIKKLKENELSSDNIEKQRTLLDIRKTGAYYKIHCRIEDFRIKYNLG